MSLSQSTTAPTNSSTDIAELRVQLKTWEHSFRDAHGHKPAKSDIKANQEIAAKYKLYDKLTRPNSKAKTSKPATATQSTTTTPKKRKRDDPRDSGVGIVEDQTNTNALRTPSRASLKADGTIHPSVIDPYDPPLNTLFSPMSDRGYVNPTPQPNGRVLGLFDLLSPESAQKNTPSKSRGMFAGTPSRSRVSQLDLLAATPSRRNMLTPSKNGRNGAMTATPSLQRTRASALDLETPECLKRYPRKTVPTPPKSADAENGGGGLDDTDGLMNIKWSPIPDRLPRKRYGRSFSELAKDIRKREERQLDDELDILRDLEQEAAGPPPPKRARSSPIDGEPLGRDIPGAGNGSAGGDDLPLGPDGEREIDRSDNEDAAVGDSQAGGRRWKKKGPKRQTKKFNIRPTHNIRWKPEAEWKAGMSDGDENDQDAVPGPENDEDVVPETQTVPGAAALADSDEDAFELELEDELGSDFEKSTKRSKKPASRPVKEIKPKPTKEPKQAKKKISATAHANYRMLKIKNKNSKAKGRFGRGRR